MEFQNLIKQSSMLRTVLDNIDEECVEDAEVARCIEKLQRDLGGFGQFVSDNCE